MQREDRTQVRELSVLGERLAPFTAWYCQSDWATPKSSSPWRMVLILTTEPPVDSTEQRMPWRERLLVDQAADGATGRVVNACDTTRANGHELRLRHCGGRHHRRSQPDGGSQYARESSRASSFRLLQKPVSRVAVRGSMLQSLLPATPTICASSASLATNGGASKMGHHRIH